MRIGKKKSPFSLVIQPTRWRLYNATIQRKIFRVNSGKTRASMVHTINVIECYFVSKFVMRWRTSSSTRASLLFQHDWYFISDELCLS
jgi:ABC-type long-subunit fatty acid transport system fused permease/ATPase subunit